jgi:outer membrane protein assembly factor BamA
MLLKMRICRGASSASTWLLILLSFLLPPIAKAPDLVAQQQPETREEEWRRRREEKSKNLKPDERNSVERAALYIQREKILQKLSEGWKGFHPKLGGLSTGSGFAGGVRYAPRLADGQLAFETSGAISTKTYQHYDLSIGAPQLLGGRLSTTFFGRYRSYPQEDFFGLGPNSHAEDRTNFAQEDSLFDFTVGWNWTRWLTTGIRAGYLRTNIGRGTDERFPRTEDVFSPGQFPELLRQPNFYHLDGFFKFDYRDEPFNAHSGGLYQLNYAYYDDQTLGRHTFRRIDAEIQQYFPFLKKKRVIAFRAAASLTDTSNGQSIPFYLMHPLGGSESLRGFREFRFRDRNYLLMNLEYRWEAFSGLDMAIFGDVGKVASRRRDIDLNDLESDVGFGFRFNTIKSIFLRIDVGFSHEGTRFFFKFGPAF